MAERNINLVEDSITGLKTSNGIMIGEILNKLSTEVALLGSTTFSVYRPMSIGVAGMAGFGIGDIDVAIPGMTRRMMGNYVDATGSWMCFFPIAKMRIGHSASAKYATYGANTVEMADLTTAEKTAKLGLTYTSKTDLDLGDGWFRVGTTVSGDPQLYCPKTDEAVTLYHDKGGRSSILIHDFIQNNPR